MELAIGHKCIGDSHPCFVIAEIGTGHGGALSRAGQLIQAAADGGADAVKFQHVFAEEIIHPLTGEVNLPGGSIPLFQRFKALEQNMDFYRACKDRAEELGMVFLCTPFGIASAGDLEELNVPAYKIASPELNHFPLLGQVAGYNKPVILSTGVSTLGDIERALTITGKSSVLLHCITAYPAPETEYNLFILPNLVRMFGVLSGVSDHSVDPLLVPSLAAAMGAAVIEKHITLSSRDDGLDDPIALEPDDFTRMTAAVRRAEQSVLEDTVRYLERWHTKERINSVLGNGIKRLAPSEQAHYLTTKRSIHAVRDIGEGETLTETNTALLRTEKVLKPGLFPEFQPVILGKKTVKPVPDGAGITWDDVIP